jgi:hypothetical protein
LRFLPTSVSKKDFSKVGVLFILNSLEFDRYSFRKELSENGYEYPKSEIKSLKQMGNRDVPVVTVDGLT